MLNKIVLAVCVLWAVGFASCNARVVADEIPSAKIAAVTVYRLPELYLPSTRIGPTELQSAAFDQVRATDLMTIGDFRAALGMSKILGDECTHSRLDLRWGVVFRDRGGATVGAIYLPADTLPCAMINGSVRLIDPYFRTFLKREFSFLNF